MRKSKVNKGEVYGYLTILEDLGTNEKSKRIVLCECKCGNIIKIRHSDIKNNNTKSCGCKKKEKGRVFTEEHKSKISNSNTGKKMSIESRYKNMMNSSNYVFDIEWIVKFKNINKIILLNKLVAKTRDRLSNDDYIKFIEKFYNDVVFNKIYDKWLMSGKKTYLRPSIDHIIPVSKGGSNNIDNIQILTWFENRCKNDMTMDEWNEMKKNIKDYLI